MDMDPASVELWLNSPAMDPPPGVEPNFIDPPDLKVAGIVVVTLCLLASSFVVGMRMWTKTRLVRKVVLEDWVCCLAQLAFVGICVISILSADRGSGRHFWNVRVKDAYATRQVGQIGRVLYCADLFLIKLAILLQLLRIFVPLHKRNAMFWICHALIGLNFVYYTAYIFLAIFACKPVSLGWTPVFDPFAEGTCLDLRTAYITGAAINAVSDISIVILPQPLIWSLQLSPRRQIGLCAIFLIGLSACAASIVRLVYSVQSVHTQDFSYLVGELNLWAIVEATCGILAMCLPISPKFLRSLQDSPVWSTLRLLSFSRSSARSTGNSEAPSDESKEAKLSDSPAPTPTHNFKAYFKQYNYRSANETELDSVSSQAGMTRNGRNSGDVERA